MKKMEADIRRLAREYATLTFEWRDRDDNRLEINRQVDVAHEALRALAGPVMSNIPRFLTPDQYETFAVNFWRYYTGKGVA